MNRFRCCAFLSSFFQGDRLFHHAGIWLGVALLMVVICFIDGAYVAQHFSYGQWVSSFIMIVYYVWMYRNASPRLRAMMKYGVVVGIVGEVLFSLVVGMYEYRLANVPVYVPPGHSILYGAVYYFVREPVVLKHQRLVNGVMVSLSLAYVGYWMIAHQDVFGTLCAVVFVALVVKHKESRTFFLAMFLFVAYLEQVGTRFQAWYWHSTLLGRIPWIPSGNPPSGISVFYFLFDAGVLFAYLTRRKAVRARYRRLQRTRSFMGCRSPV